MKKVLVTGGNSFTGQHLVPRLRNAGYQTYTLSKTEDTHSPLNYVGDIENFDKLYSTIRSLEPDFIIHLAGISFAAHPQPLELYKVNLLGTENLLRAVEKAGNNIQKIILASSANIYGNCITPLINETTCPAPVNHYAISKLAMEHMAKTRMDKLPIIIVRPFNYIGPGQNKKFLVPKIIQHFIDRSPNIQLGNTNIYRDFTDVRIICDYYLKLLEAKNAVGETFNLCSGRLISFGQIINEISKISDHTIHVEINPEFIRETDIEKLSGSPEKLYATIGHQKHPPMKETLRWIYEQSRRQIPNSL